MKTRTRQLLCGVVLVLLCLLLTACVEVQMKFELRADGSGIAGWTVEIPKGTTESLGMTSEKVKAEMLKDRQFQKPGVETRIGRAPNGNETVTVTMPFSSVQELSSDDMRFEFQKSPDGRQCTFSIKTSAQPVPIQVRAEVHMPGRITSSNADSVSGNVARYNNVLRGDGISVQSDIGGFLSTTMLAALLGGAAAVLVIVLLLVWMNRKRGRAVPVADPAAPVGARCRQCGADNKAGAKFCRNCGGPLDAPAAPPAPAETAKCPRCGVPVAPGKKFCPACGAPQGVPEAASAPPAPPPVPERAAPPQQPAKSNAMLIALSASLILLLLAVVLLVYKLWLRDRAAAPPSSPAQTAGAVAPQTETPAQPAEPAAPEAQPGASEAVEPQAAAPLAGTQPAQPGAQEAAEPKAAAPVAAAPPAGRASPKPSKPVRPSPVPAAPAPPAPSQPPPAYLAPPQPAPVAETPAAPLAPAPAAPASTPRQPILRPEPTPAPSTPSAPPAPVYSGPRSGVIIWSGQLEREGRIDIRGATASGLPGTLRGELPGVPVIIEVEPKDVGVAEAPSPQNGWRRLVLRSRSQRMSVVTIKWTVIQ